MQKSGKTSPNPLGQMKKVRKHANNHVHPIATVRRRVTSCCRTTTPQSTTGLHTLGLGVRELVGQSGVSVFVYTTSQSEAAVDSISMLS